jgi:hypothetical protein
LNKNLDNKIENNFSIVDIEELDISGELKTRKLNIDRLINLIPMIKKKFEFYDILTLLNSNLNTKEFNLEKILLYREKLLEILEIILFKDEKQTDSKDNNNFCNNHDNFIFDPVLMPFIFICLKNIFSKIKKYEKLNLSSNFENNGVVFMKKSRLNNSKNSDFNNKKINSLISKSNTLDDSKIDDENETISNFENKDEEIINMNRSLLSLMGEEKHEKINNLVTLFVRRVFC